MQILLGFNSNGVAEHPISNRPYPRGTLENKFGAVEFREVEYSSIANLRLPLILVNGEIQGSDARENTLDEDLALVARFAEQMRVQFSGGAGDGKRDSYQLNSDIINLLDAGKTWGDLDPALVAKVDTELANTAKYSGLDRDGLVAIWRAKRGVMVIASAWIEAFEDNTTEALKAAPDAATRQSIINSAKAEAEQKAAELMQQASG